ncbi:ketosteroid isomerase-like enzyme [Candidatus Nitrososphaera evergladensis SR1]|uniref:Ketosteroid isomerase-like enzyme n=2 Tax=Nitrososphaera TaxID=497726 RepID=A0A075MPR8_9ARCH|nr:ketosteroid isomerase-like enzyme [Candidatus Nitrososphaera evergladensis SR1]
MEQQQPNPLETIKNLIAAINQGDLDAASSLYDPEAVIIAQPGNIARGRDAIRAALQGFISLKPLLKGEADQVIEAGGTALYISRWTLVGTSPDGKSV